MSLLTDVNIFGITKEVININILRQIEDDLDIDEKVSILFLITENYADAFDEIFNLFQKAKTENTYIITEYVNNHPKNWEEKFLEAICILNNRQIIRKLRVPLENLDLQYYPKIRYCSKNINTIAKCLYLLCESLDENEQKLLLSNVQSENTNYESLLDSVDYLELHMLYWMKNNYITISKDGKHNMKNLLKHLKLMDDLKIICMDLEKCENHFHVGNINNPLVMHDENLQATSAIKESFMENHYYRKRIRHINNGLCIIINQIYFGKEYETRFGTSADCVSLSETFRAFGFEVYILENLKKREMLRKIKNIPKEHDIKYDCLFLCILSHGYKGGIIASDEEEVSLETIEKTICCIELKDVIKIVIIQACQGEVHGSINDNLTTDGLSNLPMSSTSDIRAFENFFLFMSTMQGFVSIRHKEQGSWFIQEFCKILNNYGNQLTFFECIREIMISMRKKKGTIEGNHIAQLSEIRQDRLESDFQLKCVVTSTV